MLQVHTSVLVKRIPLHEVLKEVAPHACTPLDAMLEISEYTL
jgi:hypothetical protein